MTEFWEASFQDKQTMWGFEPADSAIEALSLFQRHGLQKILIPGFGYGRNAKIFIDQGLDVTGIEISETAIALAKKHYGNELTIHHGPVGDMAFDEELYDGIYCYALIHLLDEAGRAKLISDCYRQLRPGGYMIFVAISTRDNAYGKGEPIGKDQFLTKHGVELFFYNADSIAKEFENYGLLESREIEEPAKHSTRPVTQWFWMITCRRDPV